MSSFQRSGKTAPRLVQDIHDYDFIHPPSTGRNLLRDIPPVYPEHCDGEVEYISASACRHQYVTKPAQSFLQAGATSPPKVSAVCLKCRCHLQVIVNLTSALGHTHQDPDHVHHLVYKSGRQVGGPSPEEITPKGQTAETYRYECSYLTCSIAVSVRIASPILNEDWTQLLTDPEVLQKRASEAMATYPDRMEGMAVPDPLTVLLTLQAYMANALNDGQRSKSISSVNKRFMNCFGIEGRPCKELLEFLEFSAKNEGFWEPPRPSPWAEFPYHDQLKIFLDDTLHELAALIEQRPVIEKKGHQLEFNHNPAINELLLALGALEYPRAFRTDGFQMASEPVYEDLGTVEDMSAVAIIDAFNRQVSVDPARTSMYLHCLKSIGNLRGGEDKTLIDQAVELAYAEGKYTNEDVYNAYRYFGLSYDDTRLTEDSIIGKFYAYLSSTTQEDETRRQLWIIGDSRRSDRIQSAAEDRVATVEQAQVFLGVNNDTSDDFIMAMYTAKVNDSPSTKELSRRAIELIGEARKSNALKHFLSTGEMTSGEMDIGDAYRLLQIPDRTVDEGAIMAAYTICVDEAPAQVETYNQALAIIAKEKNSPLLNSMVSGSAPKPVHNMSEWPVGLENIGNTCYLNSLLQFYFSVRPYRQMVLNFETFKMTINEESLSKKQVGSRKVSRKEVERSQKFLRELRTLFSDMIHSPTSFVIPGQELARLTLISPSNEAAIRRRSTISAIRPVGLGEINGAPVLGPLGPPQPTTEGEIQNPAALDAEKPQRTTTSDVDSDATLVSDGNKNATSASSDDATIAPNDDHTIGPSDDKENELPQPADSVMTDVQGKSTPEAPQASGPDNKPSEEQAAPSNKPPPVPPRPAPQGDSQKQQILDEVEIGAQQDVTEVINNVLFQSQCAIEPNSIAPDGEQIDRIKDLFYGQARSYILSNEGVRSKEERWCDIKIDVATGSRDIYAAIDGAFDIQKVNVGDSVAEQYSAISRLPPVLQVQVQRVQFDPVKKRSFKSTHHLELKETIYLDRYMDTQQPEILDRRRQCWEWKDNIRKLEARRDELLRVEETDSLDMPTLFNSAREGLEDLNTLKDDSEFADDAIDVNPQLFPELEQLSQLARSQLSSIDQEIKDTQTMISSQFADSRRLPYRLYAVFVHHGSVTFGHYYIYIRDFERNIWRKYNDNYVTEVNDLDEIFMNNDRQNPPTPYFLVYVNDGMKERLVDPVCRGVVENQADNHEPQGPADPPTDMEGVTTQAAPSEVEMNPPSYEEIWTDKGATGTGDHHRAVAAGDGKETPTGPSKENTNNQNVQW
ncbi:ubiquitin-specific protease UBP2 [Aspergillus affinis]|uniref:ubiquitin-specific protease UBP2 n=1 Tax=Aspergillus affinis TaxID=1070780 RepID=UPI0022FECCDC|nr:ubiquitin carboxyl-terminal hydrolase [Aspergillus affinis]KAI9038196.1 ubiquitin carboxyl-terminal hydrolase [Aspergillus affinis]